MRWCVATDGRLLLLVQLLAGVVRGRMMETAPYKEDTCYCYSDGFNDTIRGAIANFSYPPEPAPYHYTGARYKGNDRFVPCSCSDVTRVTTVLMVTENDTVAAAGDEAIILSLTNNVTMQLNKLLKSMKETWPSLEPTLMFFTVNCSRTASNSSIPCDVEALLRGHNAQLKDDVSEALKANLSSGMLVGVGSVDPSEMTFTVPQCTDDPEVHPTNGQMTFISKLTGSTATYTCDPGYRLSTLTEQEVSVCDHTQATWTSLPDNLSCIKDKRCTDSPPAEPHHASYNWNGIQKEEGTVVQYTCLAGYKPTERESQTSTCTEKIWTKISPTFMCEYNGCADNPPQVPDNAKLVFTSKTEGSLAIYTCMRNYRAIGPEPKLECKNKTWSVLPGDFKCVKNDGSYISEEEIFEESSYLVIITIPSVAGLIVVIICCLCCTRTDSPLFYVCSSRGRDGSYA